MRPPEFRRLVPENDESSWESLRELRNQCREFMTEHTAWITRRQQEEFRERFDPETQEAYLLIADSGPVGFLYLRLAADCWFPTYGVAEAERNRGYGKLLVAWSQVIRDKLVLEVRPDNERARGLYAAMGFRPTGKNTMVWER